jgi:hypothetical protein
MVNGLSIYPFMSAPFMRVRVCACVCVCVLPAGAFERQ